MPDIRTTTVTALLLALMATGAQAQEQAPEAPEAPAEEAAPAEAGTEGDQPAPQTTEEALGLSMGEEASQVGQTYMREEHGDWEIRCVRTETGADPCQLYQLLDDEGGNNVAEVSIFPLPEGNQAVAGATIITPLETLLTAQVALRVDSGEVKRYPFTFCSTVGCFSRMGFTAEDLASLRRGANATLQIRPAAAPDQTVDLTVSLSGFTAGFDAVAAANEAARERQEELQQQQQPEQE